MSAADASIAAFEQRAVRAEELVRLISSQVDQLRQKAEQTELARLEKENESLRKEIDQAKQSLRAAQAASGKTVVPLPGENSAATQATSQASPVAAASASVDSQPTKSKGEKKGKAEGKKDKGDKKAAKAAGKADKGGNKGAAAEAASVDVSRIDFRIGKIVKAEMHPDADSLYLETIDVGEEKPRTVISGLAAFVPLEQMQNRMVVLCCNLKPRKMRGIESQAMVMCVKAGDKLEILAPPEGAVPGDVVEFEGFPRNPDNVLNPKKKIFEAVQPDLLTDDNAVATYKGVPFMVPGKGVCKANELKKASIS